MSFRSLPVTVISWALGISVAVGAGCSSSRKTTLELSALRGKKVALVEIDGEASAKAIAEVALINQLTRRGSFVLISKREVEEARLAPDQDPTDWRGAAKRAGAEYALRVKVLDFTSEVREGYDTEEVYDDQLAEERGKEGGNTQRVYRTKALEGNVKYELEFTPLKDAKDPKDLDTRVGVAEHSERIVQSAKDKGINLPPRLRFLEKLSNEAFRKFFDQYE